MKLSIGVVHKTVVEDAGDFVKSLLKGINESLHALSMLDDRPGCSSKSIDT